MTNIIISFYSSSLWIYGPFAATPTAFPSPFVLLSPHSVCGIRCPLSSWNRKARDKVSTQGLLEIHFQSWIFVHCWRLHTCSISQLFFRTLLLYLSPQVISAFLRWTSSWIRASLPKWSPRSSQMASPASPRKRIPSCMDQRQFPSWCLCWRSSNRLHHIILTFSH